MGTGGCSTCIEVGGPLHDCAELEVLWELGLVQGLVEALGVHGATQADQAQVPLHLWRYLLCRQIKPAPVRVNSTYTFSALDVQCMLPQRHSTNYW